MVNDLHYAMLPEALVILLIILVTTAFWVWQFVKCCIQEAPSNAKIAWLLLIAVTHLVGATIYSIYNLIYKRN